MPVSEAQKKASVKYLEKLDEVRIRMPKGRKEAIKAAAVAAGESMNQYIITAIDQRMEQDGARGLQEPTEDRAVSLSETIKTDSSGSEGA